MIQGSAENGPQPSPPTERPPKPLALLGMARGGTVGAWAGALGGLAAAVLFGIYSGWTTNLPHGFWQEVVGASLCFGVPLFSFGWVIGYAGGAVGGLVGAITITKAGPGRGGVVLGTVLGFAVAAGVEWLLIPRLLLDGRQDWFVFLAAACTPVGSGIGGAAGAFLALSRRRTA